MILCGVWGKISVKKLNNGEMRCDCGKLIAVERNGRIFVKCRCCGRQVEVARDPRGQDSRGQ